MSDIQRLVDEAMAKFNALTPEQQAEHRRLQQESWVRTEMSWPKAKFKYVNGAKVYDSFEDYCND